MTGLDPIDQSLTARFLPLSRDVLAIEPQRFKGSRSRRFRGPLRGRGAGVRDGREICDEDLHIVGPELFSENVIGRISSSSALLVTLDIVPGEKSRPLNVAEMAERLGKHPSQIERAIDIAQRSPGSARGRRDRS